MPKRRRRSTEYFRDTSSTVTSLGHQELGIRAQLGFRIEGNLRVLPDAERGAEAIPEVHEGAAGEEMGAALTAVDEEEVAESVAVDEAVEEVVVEAEGVGVEGLVPFVVGGDYYVVFSLGYKMVAPS